MTSSPETGVRLATFVVGSLVLGLPVECVLEVVSDQPLTPVPLSPPAVVGLLNLRGQIVPAVDARIRLQLASRPEGDGCAHVIVSVLGEQVSLVVDSTADVVTLPAGDRQDVPETVSPEIRRLLSAAFQQPGHLLLVLDPQLVLTDL